MPTPCLAPSAPHALPLDLAALGDRLERTAQRLLRAAPSPWSTAADLAQETVCRLLSHYGIEWLAARPPALVESMARRSMRNLLVDERRRHRARLDEAAVHAAVDATPSPERRVADAEAERTLARALATLAPCERAFLIEVMRRDSVPAAQRIVGWPRASPYYHLTRLLTLLRTELGGLTHTTPPPRVSATEPPRQRPPSRRVHEHHRQPAEPPRGP